MKVTTNKFIKRIALTFIALTILTVTKVSAAEDALKNFHYNYHHKLVDKEGQTIQLDKNALVSTQLFYINAIASKSDNRVQRELRSITEFMQKAKISDRERAHIRHSLIQVLAEKNKTKESALILKKSVAMSIMIDSLFFDKQDAKKIGPVSKDTISYMEKSAGNNGLAFIFELLIQALIDALRLLASYDDYERDCVAAGVPVPPDWGSNRWQNLGELSDEFLLDNLTAEVFVYDSSYPVGTCVALPRSSGSTIGALGIICLGVNTENACFWDGEGMSVNSQFSIRDRMRGGIDLARPNGDAINGECSDCHAGENPFISRRAPSILSFSGFSTNTNWYTPIGLHSSWSQNPGPTSLLDSVSTEFNGAWGITQDGESCINCHSFPDVTQLPGYCETVLKLSARRTMPSESDPAGWSWPNNSDFRKHIKELRQACP